MQNDISGFRELLWSLFNSYSYVPSNRGGRKGAFPTRRLSESGYRAIISSLATSDVLRRFFVEEDEITLLEAQKRMDSEKFKEEMWGEALRASALLFDRTDTAFGFGEEVEEESEREDVNMLLTMGYDYDAMQPSSEYNTVNWTVFNSLLILRLSNAFHFHIGKQWLEECRESLEPLMWLVPLPPHNEAMKFTDDKSGSCSIERKQLTTTFIQLSPLRNEKEQLNPCSTTSRSSFQGPSGSCSVSAAAGALTTNGMSHEGSANYAECTAICSGKDVNPDIPRPVPRLSEVFPTRHDRNGEVRVVSNSIGLSTLLTGPGGCRNDMKKRTNNSICDMERIPSTTISLELAEVKLRNTGVLRSQETRGSGETKYSRGNALFKTEDAFFLRSTPPPRPRQCAIPHGVMPFPYLEGRVTARKGVPVDDAKLRRKIAKRIDDSSEWSVGETLDLVSYGSPELSLTAAIGEDFVDCPCAAAPKDSDGYSARYDEKVNQRPNVDCIPTLHTWKSLTVPSPSPSPDVNENNCVKGWITVPAQKHQTKEASIHEAGPTANMTRDHKEESNTKGTEKVEEIKRSEPAAHSEGQRQQSMEFSRQPRLQRGRPMPPQSPSRRALSRLQLGPRPYVRPLVPTARAPLTPRVCSKTAAVSR